MSSLDKVLEKHRKIVLENYKAKSGKGFKRYAVSNLRGGVGKSSIAFNLAYEISRHNSVMLADVCPQCNFTELLLGDFRPKVNIYDGIRPIILGSAFGEEPDDLSYKVSKYCESFKGGKSAWMIGGNPELFAFPSLLYQQLNTAYAQRNEKAVAFLLKGLQSLLTKEAKANSCEKILIDTSPFYAGGTHLAWCAVDALIVPVRVDEHSLESLDLLFRQLSEGNKDFQTWNDRAGGLNTPKIAAIVMTMVGSRSQLEATPDKASCMYIERAIAIAEKYHRLFAHNNPSDAFVITEDFHSAGRISGAKRIPINELEVGQFHTVEGRRLQVNASVGRYKRQLSYLASMI